MGTTQSVAMASELREDTESHIAQLTIRINEHIIAYGKVGITESNQKSLIREQLEILTKRRSIYVSQSAGLQAQMALTMSSKVRMVPVTPASQEWSLLSFMSSPSGEDESTPTPTPV